MSACLGLIYAYRLGNHQHCTFIDIFLCSCFLRFFSLTYMITSIPKTKYTFVWFQVLLSNIDKYMFSSNYFNLIFVIVCTQFYECPGYDIKPCDGKGSALEIWRMWNTNLLLLLPIPLWPGVVAHDWVLSVGQIEQTICAILETI